MNQSMEEGRKAGDTAGGSRPEEAGLPPASRLFLPAPVAMALMRQSWWDPHRLRSRTG